MLGALHAPRLTPNTCNTPPTHTDPLRRIPDVVHMETRAGLRSRQYLSALPTAVALFAGASPSPTLPFQPLVGEAVQAAKRAAAGASIGRGCVALLLV